MPLDAKQIAALADHRDGLPAKRGILQYWPVFVVLAALGGGGYYYFKYLRPMADSAAITTTTIAVATDKTQTTTPPPAVKPAPASANNGPVRSIGAVPAPSRGGLAASPNTTTAAPTPAITSAVSKPAAIPGSIKQDTQVAAPATSKAQANPSPATTAPAPLATTKSAPAASASAIPEGTGIDGIWRKVTELEQAKDNVGMAAALERIAAEHPTDEHGGNAFYRLGFLAQQQGKQAEAKAYWERGAKEAGNTAGGRLCAMVIADMLCAQYCGADPVYEKWEQIRDLYSQTMGRDRAAFLDAATKARVIGNLTALNAKLVFGPLPCTGSIIHEVTGNDRLYSIAQKYKVHPDAIAIMNYIKMDIIRSGQKLKILPLQAEIIVDKKELNLTLFLGGKWIKQYQVCIGPGDKTPVGTFYISSKEKNPAWTDPSTKINYRYGDPANILGTRWLGFKRDGGPGEGIGIHGTTLPETVPGRVSNGCVRLRNAEVEELFGFALIGTAVTILPEK